VNELKELCLIYRFCGQQFLLKQQVLIIFQQFEKAK